MKRKQAEVSLQRHEIRVIISGGGTGGHIFPAIAIANALKLMNERNEILFVGAHGRMEMEKVPAAGYKIEGLPISGIQRKLTLSNLLVPFKALKSVMIARSILKNFKPDVAVGVGGYASGPLLYAASAMKIPSLIQEQNSFAGITNKLLARRVQKICVAYPGTEKYFPAEKIVMTGNPVRQDIDDLDSKRMEGYQHFRLNENRKTILVIGGSLGARTLNESILPALQVFADGEIQLLWQTGKAFINKAAEAAVKFSDKGIRVYDFIKRMDLAYAVADIVISRAGAISISELCLAAKPAILVPSPNVAEDHQTHNAMALVSRNAALLVKDDEAGRSLVTKAMDLLKNESLKNSLKENIHALAVANSAGKIAEEIYSLVRK